MKQITSYVKSNGYSTSKANLMDLGLQETLQTFLGGGSGQVFQAGDSERHQDKKAVAIVTGASTGQQVARLRGQGFTRFKEFALLPSANSTRWIIPMDDSHCTRSGLNIYMPYATRARAIKNLLSAITRTGWTGWARQKVLVASRQPLNLEALASEVTGEKHLVFALSLGTPGPFRKVTIQVMKEDGEVLGYVKFPMTHEAAARVRHEAEMLEHLSQFSVLRSHIPRLLFAGEWEQGYILFQSAGSADLAPAEFGSSHQQFLKNLWSIDGIEKPGEMLVEEVGSRWRVAEQQLDSEWQALGDEALKTASRELSMLTIRCGMTHGDFTPWNTRICEGRLFVFDWESAETHAPHQWDMFHFNAQVASLLNRKDQQEFPLDRNSGERALYLLYLLFSAVNALDGKTEANQIALSCRKRLLREELST